MERVVLIVAAFFTGLLTDIAWAQWTLQSNLLNIHSAARWSVVTYFCSVVSAFLVVEHDWIAIAAFGIGCYLGTWYGVKKAAVDRIRSKCNSSK